VLIESGGNAEDEVDSDLLATLDRRHAARIAHAERTDAGEVLLALLDPLSQRPLDRQRCVGRFGGVIIVGTTLVGRRRPRLELPAEHVVGRSRHPALRPLVIERNATGVAHSHGDVAAVVHEDPLGDLLARVVLDQQGRG
jgi:hypothetical protein